jgi:6-phosphogluconolactonase
MRIITLLLSLTLYSLSASSQNFYLFVGTYTKGTPSKGIYVYQFDAATGDAKLVSTVATDDPSYLALAPGDKFLYAANETDGKPGAVSAFSFDKASGQLKFLDQQPSGGGSPCYVSVDAHRKWVMVANYGGGNLAALPIRADGSLAPLTQLIQHTGAGPNKQRQEKPHVHSVTFSPDQQYLISADLGLDKLSIYRFNAASTTQPLTIAKDSVQQVEPGAGPRHISFYPGKPYVYAMMEMGGAVDVFRWSNGKLVPFQHISSLPDDFHGDIGSADIHVAPKGKFLYASNRGDANSLAIYAIDTASGKLTIKGFESTQGKTPRNFMIDPTGHWLLVANQRSDNIVIFHIDPATGLLKATGKQLSVPAPVCLKMARK